MNESINQSINEMIERRLLQFSPVRDTSHWLTGCLAYDYIAAKFSIRRI